MRKYPPLLVGFELRNLSFKFLGSQIDAEYWLLKAFSVSVNHDAVDVVNQWCVLCLFAEMI